METSYTYDSVKALTKSTINGICLLPVLPFTKISAYCFFSGVSLNTTSFIFNFNNSCGLAAESRDIAW